MAAAQTATSTIQGKNSYPIKPSLINCIIEKTSAILDSSKQVLASSPLSQSAPVTPAVIDHVAQEADVAETSRDTAHGSEANTAEQLASTPTKATKGGALATIRNFFSRLFGSSHRHEERQKANSNASTNPAGQTNEAAAELTTTAATVATTNPPISS